MGSTARLVRVHWNNFLRQSWHGKNDTQLRLQTWLFSLPASFWLRPADLLAEMAL